MASIPLPALHTQAPEQPDILGSVSKIMQLRGLTNQNQLQNQAIQEGGLQIEAEKRANQERQTIMQAQADAAGDPKKYLPALQGKINPGTYAQLIEQDAKTRKELADADTATRNNLKAKNDQLLGLVNQAKNMSPEQYAQSWPQIIQSAEEIHPGTVQKYGLDPSKPVPQESLAGITVGLQSADQYFKQAEEDAKAAKRPFEQQEAEGKASAAVADADTKVRQNAASKLAAATNPQQYASVWGELPAKVAKMFPAPEQWTPDAKDSILRTGMTPKEQQMTPELQKTRYQQILQKQQLGQQLTPQEIAEANAYAAANSHNESKTDNLGFTTSSTTGPPRVGGGSSFSTAAASARGNAASPASAQQAVASGTSGDAYLQKLPPQQRALVKGIATYDIDPQRIMMRNPQVIDAVKQFDPSYDQGIYSQIQAARKEFEVGGKGAQNIRSLNQLVGHLGRLADTAKELNNTGMPAVNWVWNEGRKVLAPNVLDRFNTDAEAVAGELATLFKNGVGSEGEIAAWRDKVNPNMAKESLVGDKSVINEAQELMASRFNAVASQYQAAMRGKEAKQGLLTQHSRDILKNLPGGQAIVEQDNAIRGKAAQQTGAGNDSGAGGGMVTMKAPNGQTKQVPADQVEHYKAKGAVVVTQ